MTQTLKCICYYLENVSLFLHALVYDPLHNSQKIYNEDKNADDPCKYYMYDINSSQPVKCLILILLLTISSLHYILFITRARNCNILIR